MKLTIGKKILISVTVLIATLWVADEYPAMRFRGDGKFSGGPVFGYWIRMQPIPFSRPGEYVFRFHGTPSEEMSLQLYADGKSHENRPELTNLSTHLEALLLDQQGRTVCHASGIVPTEHDPCHDCTVLTDQEIEARRQKEWVLMSGPDEAAYWHENCLRMPLRPSADYILTVRVMDVDARTPKINLVPTLEGGQPDLP